MSDSFNEIIKTISTPFPGACAFRLVGLGKTFMNSAILMLDSENRNIGSHA